MSAELPDAASVDASRAHRASLVRALLVCAVWIATLSLRRSGPGMRLGLDLLLAVGGLWAAAPGRNPRGPLFGEHGHWVRPIDDG